jgi:hypothetical protein
MSSPINALSLARISVSEVAGSPARLGGDVLARAPKSGNSGLLSTDVFGNLRRTISARRKTGQGKPLSGVAQGVRMHIVTRTNDLVRLSFLQALLQDAGIDAFVLDGHTSAVDGSIGAIPRRLAVPEGDGPAARRVLREAGEDWS